MKVKLIAVATLIVAIFASVQAVQAQGLFRGRFVCAGGSCAQSSGYSATYQRVGFFGRGAGLFGRCSGGSCYQGGAAYYENAYAQYSGASVPPCAQAGEYIPCDVEAPKPCEPTLETVEQPTPPPCDPVKVEACEPVQTVEPCAPVSTCETCPNAIGVTRQELTYSSVGTCPNGACPLRTAVKATAKTAQQAVKKVVSTASWLAAVNRTRAAYGLAALRGDAALDAGCAQATSHCATVGGLDHTAGNEILAYNQSGIDAAIVSWLNSPAHRAYLLSPSFTAAGISVVRDRYGRVWCAMRFR